MELGRADVDAMLEEISSAQLSEWMAYFAVEPFGSQLLDVHLATLEAMFINAHQEKGRSAVQAKEYFLIQPPTQANPMSVFQKLKSFMTAQKGLQKHDG